jgi:hypothetical protein
MNGTRTTRSELILNALLALGDANNRNTRLKRTDATPTWRRFSPIAAMKTQKKNSRSRSQGVCMSWRLKSGAAKPNYC